ncbi:MAG: rod shape-determining protein MreC [Erythrobacter sp.]
MAPPSSRRSGHSRRAQYSVFTGYLLAALGALVGAGLLALSLFRPDAFEDLRGVATDMAEPAGEASAATRSETQSWWATISGYFEAGSQNAALREEVEIARIRLIEAEAVEQENQRLRELLDLGETEMEPVVISRLIGSSSASSRRFAYLGAGEQDGVTIGMPVRSPRGIIGRVLEVSSRSARVLLLTDSESVLPVRRTTDETVAFAEGRGDGLLRIRLINLGINPLEMGDTFVTSGAGGFYRPGVAVATVIEVTPDGAIGRLIAEPSAADFVSVQPIWQAETAESAETPVEIELGE